MCSNLLGAKPDVPDNTVSCSCSSSGKLDWNVTTDDSWDQQSYCLFTGVTRATCIGQGNVYNDDSKGCMEYDYTSTTCSQNGGTWTAEQNEDVKFKVKRASFTENTIKKIHKRYLERFNITNISYACLATLSRYVIISLSISNTISYVSDPVGFILTVLAPLIVPETTPLKVSF